MKNLLKILPENIKKRITDYTEEIRIRLSKPVIILNRSNELVLNEIITLDTFSEILDNITESSVYAFFEDINNGFITIRGGHRVGVCGNAVTNDKKITAIKDLSSLNIRVAREITGVGERLFKTVANNNRIKNTIIISPPGCGKTTLLRDLTRLLSNNIEGIKIALIDERSEIAASYMGEAQNDVGIRTDVFVGYSKKDGILQAVRSMSPTVIVVDEIGTEEDLESIIKAHRSGVKIIASIHGNDFNNIPDIFEYAIKLSKNSSFDRIEEIICLN